MPLRPANSAHGAGMALYRRIRWGRLAIFHMLDTRQFRDDQVCGDLIEVCPDADRPDHTIIGAAQERWLLDGLARQLGVWDLLGQQVFFAGQRNAAGAGNMDDWEGYRAARDRLQHGWVDRNVRSPVVLTGDVHQSWANDLKADYADPDSATIGAELVCTSISAGGDGTGSTLVPDAAVNRHLRFFSDRRATCGPGSPPTGSRPTSAPSTRSADQEHRSAGYCRLFSGRHPRTSTPPCATLVIQPHRATRPSKRTGWLFWPIKIAGCISTSHGLIWGLIRVGSAVSAAGCRASA